MKNLKIRKSIREIHLVNLEGKKAIITMKIINFQKFFKIIF